MNRRLIVICAVMILALAVPAFAAVQNVKVGGDIITSGVARNNFDLGKPGATTSGGKDNSDVFMSQVRVRVDADLTDNVSTTIRLLNERDWDQEAVGSKNTTGVDLDLAYVTLKEMLYSPLTVVIGRQPLRYGNAMIIGDPDTSRLDTSSVPAIQNRDLSVRKAFDAIKAILNYDPLTIDLFYSKLDENDKISSVTAEGKDDVDLYGVNANYKVGDKYNSVVEAYYIQKRDDSIQGNNQNNADVVSLPGLRIATNPIEGLSLSLEQAWQFGSKYMAAAKNRKREAMATQIIANYALQCEKLKKWSPVVGVGFSRFSGDKNAASTNGEYEAWDPMYVDQGVGTISNVLFDKTNVRVINANVSAKPIEDVTVKLDWTTLYLDRKLNVDRWESTGGSHSGANLFTLYQTGGGSLNPAMTPGKKHLGQEIDVLLTYDYTEDVQLSLLGGLYASGNAFEKVANRDSRNATELIGSCKVTF